MADALYSSYLESVGASSLQLINPMTAHDKATGLPLRSREQKGQTR
jgi:hypothetical protein